jgi:hypothetical protein
MKLKQWIIQNKILAGLIIFVIAFIIINAQAKKEVNLTGEITGKNIGTFSKAGLLGIFPWLVEMLPAIPVWGWIAGGAVALFAFLPGMISGWINLFHPAPAFVIPWYVWVIGIIALLLVIKSGRK